MCIIKNKNSHIFHDLRTKGCITQLILIFFLAVSEISTSSHYDSMGELEGNSG